MEIKDYYEEVENEIVEVTDFVRVEHSSDLKSFYNNLNGNLYYRAPWSKYFDIVEDLNLKDLIRALVYDKFQFIWIDGCEVGVGTVIANY